jgi:uncharacterized glyoxalase superfamily protein PhnB
MAQTSPNPRGFHTLTPNLVVRGCDRALEFYARAFGGQEVARMPAPDGKSIWHAEMKIGDSIFFLNDEMPGMGAPAPDPDHPSPVTLWVFAQDCDAAHRRAVEAGAKSTMPPADMFWGDRVAEVADPFGYRWSFATHVKDVSEEEMRRAAAEFARSMPAAP